MMGPLQLEVVMPRVRKDGACAQFRPSQPEESMIQLFKAGRVEHMFILRGTANIAPGGVVELYHGGNPSQPGSQQGKVVFQAHKRPEGDWAVKYMHPLSCFQAFNIAISVFHNPTTAGLDALPAAAEGRNARASSEGGSSTTPADVRGAAPAEAPPLAGKPTSDLGISEGGEHHQHGVARGAAAPGVLDDGAGCQGVLGPVQRLHPGVAHGRVRQPAERLAPRVPHAHGAHVVRLLAGRLGAAAHLGVARQAGQDLGPEHAALPPHAQGAQLARARARAVRQAALLGLERQVDQGVEPRARLADDSLDSHGSWIRALATERVVLCSAS